MVIPDASRVRHQEPHVSDITATDPTADAATESDGALPHEVETDEGPTFEQLGLNAALLKSIKDVGYEAPTPIQIEVIPALLAGRDVIAQAQTGSGKTAAFGLARPKAATSGVRT